MEQQRITVFDRWLVVSDMDGTLLNHHDYQFDAAVPMLQKLEQMDIPVVFNTSKTFSELSLLVQQLNNRHPFIIENGSAIVVPERYFSDEFNEEYMAEAVAASGYRLKITGSEIDAINSFLREVCPDAINFTQCSLQQAIQLTGLTATEASNAQNRQYSVPLIFSNEGKESRFIKQAEQAGFSTLRGGRFLHLQGVCDKGSSMQILKDLYQRYYQKEFGIIALGDSHNDQDMLQQSDIAVVVKSPSSDSLTLDRMDTIYTKHVAPEGWTEGVQSALKLLNKITFGET